MTHTLKAILTPGNRHRNRYGKYMALAVLCMACISAYYLIAPYIDWDHARTLRRAAYIWAQAHPWVAPLCYTLGATAVTVLFLPVRIVMTLFSGYLFGFWLGLGIMLCASTLGAGILYFITRSTLREPLRKYATGLYVRIRDGMRQDAASYMLFLRLVTPFWMMNILPALFSVTFKTYIWTTFIGIVPATSIYVYFGRSLARIKDVSDLWRPDLIAAYLLIALASLIPIYYHRRENLAAV